MHVLGLKLLHVVAVVLFLGNITTGLFWKRHLDRSRDPRLALAGIEGLIRSDRWFTIPGSRVRLQPEASVFNLLNRSPDYAVRSLNYGTSSYLQPSSVLQGRYIRLGMQAKW